MLTPQNLTLPHPALAPSPVRPAAGVPASFRRLPASLSVPSSPRPSTRTRNKTKDDPGETRTIIDEKKEEEDVDDDERRGCENRRGNGRIIGGRRKKKRMRTMETKRRRRNDPDSDSVTFFLQRSRSAARNRTIQYPCGYFGKARLQPCRNARSF